MKLQLLLLNLIFTSYIFGQEVYVAEAKSDIAAINTDDLTDRFASLIEPTNGLVYVSLNLLDGDQEKMSGIDNKIVKTADLTVTVYDMLTNKTLNNKSYVISASGKSSFQANKRLLRGLKKKKAKLNIQISDAQSDMNVSCPEVNKAINTYLQQDQYKKAMALAKADICDDPITLQSKVYDAYQNAYCDQHISRTKAFIAVKNYNNAVQEIIKVSPSTRCKTEVSQIIDQLQGQYDSDYESQLSIYKELLQVQELRLEQRQKLMDMLTIKQMLND